MCSKPCPSVCAPADTPPSSLVAHHPHTPRYGAIVFDSSSRFPVTSPQPQSFLMEEDDNSWSNYGPDRNRTPGALVYGVLVNASALHAAPIFLNLVNSAALQALVANPDSPNSTESVTGADGGTEREEDGESTAGAAGAAAMPSITVRSSPLPRTRGEEAARQVSKETWMSCTGRASYGDVELIANQRPDHVGLDVWGEGV